MKLEQVKRGQTVVLNIPAARPIKLQNGTLHEGGQKYTVLGGCGTAVRLSRCSDKAKLIVLADTLMLFAEAPAPKAPTLKQLRERNEGQDDVFGVDHDSEEEQETAEERRQRIEEEKADAMEDRDWEDNNI